MNEKSAQKIYFGLLTFGASIGFLASFFQMLEKITLLKNSDAVLTCNLNSVLNCSNVLSNHISSVFGFPNSLMCIILFASLISAGIIGLTGSKINAKVRLVYQFLSLFFVGFGLWYLNRSIFMVSVLCIYCLFCFGGLLLVNFSWLRLNYRDYPLSSSTLQVFERGIKSGADIFLWCLIGVAVILQAFLKFA